MQDAHKVDFSCCRLFLFVFFFYPKRASTCCVSLSRRFKMAGEDSQVVQCLAGIVVC